MRIFTKLADSIVGTIVSNIKLDEAILLCALKAEQENKKALALELRKLSISKEES